jgi:hypothetical protein
MIYVVSFLFLANRFGYTGMGLLRGAAERKKLVAAAALIEIESLPFVEKSSVS